MLLDTNLPSKAQQFADKMKLNIEHELEVACDKQIKSTMLAAQSRVPVALNLDHGANINQIDITGSKGKAWEVRGTGLPRGKVTMKE